MARAKKAAAAKAVDPTVENQENPVVNETERPSTEITEEPKIAEMAPAQEVDETVINQENPGTSAVDRNPDHDLVTDEATGVTYDTTKGPSPEIVSDVNEEERNRLRQQSGVMDARESREDDDDFFTLYFVESGLTYSQRVYKKGESVEVAKNRAKPWMDLSAKEQEERWGHVKFEKR